MHRMMLAAAMLLLPVAAQAASLVTSPAVGSDAGDLHCSIQYIGTSTVPIPVQITAKQGNVVLRQDRTARLTAARPAYSLSLECAPGSNECYNVICAFSFTADKSLFRASACLTSSLSANNGAQLCMPAY